jgi:peptidyl-prolyl cis-trans isomerase C
MKFTGKFKYLPLLAAVSLIAFQAGQAFCEDVPASQPKAEAVEKAPPAKPTTGEAVPTAKPKQEEAAKSSPADPAAKVNGKVITRGELERAIKVLATQNRMSPQQPESAILEQLISAEVLFQAGSKLDIKELDKQIAEKIAQGKAKFPNEAAYEAALKSAGLSPKELDDLVRKDIVINNLVDKEVASKLTVPEAEAKKFYDENIDKFKKGESVKASHILCGVDPKATAEEKKKAREKAETLLKEIKSGKDFAELAKANSSCPSSAQGGDLGFFSKGQMVPPFEAAAFALKPGEVSDVVETQFGYHIIKLTEKKDAGITKFDEVKDKIQEYLKNAKMQKAVADYIDQLKAKAQIEKLIK